MSQLRRFLVVLATTFSTQDADTATTEDGDAQTADDLEGNAHSTSLPWIVAAVVLTAMAVMAVITVLRMMT